MTEDEFLTALNDHLYQVTPRYVFGGSKETNAIAIESYNIQMDAMAEEIEAHKHLLRLIYDRKIRVLEYRRSKYAGRLDEFGGTG